MDHASSHFYLNFILLVAGIVYRLVGIKINIVTLGHIDLKLFYSVQLKNGLWFQPREISL